MDDLKIDEKANGGEVLKTERESTELTASAALKRRGGKRVELAIHSGFSPKRGVGSARDYVKEAMRLGLHAIAVTDRNTVSGLPTFYRAVEGKSKLKIIYGMDAECVYDLKEDLPPEVYNALPTVRVSILMKNEKGRRNLYRMISQAEEKYAEKGCDGAKLSLRKILENREGLLLGSGRKEGVLQRYLSATSIPDLPDPMTFLDYVEIPAVCEEELARKLVHMAEAQGIPAVAEAAPYTYDRKSLLVNHDLEEAQSSLLLETEGNALFFSTDQMLRRFAYLGEETAYRIVVENTNLIAEQCTLDAPFTKISYCANEAENAELLRKLCMEKLEEKYPNASKAVMARLEWELQAIDYTSSEYMFLNIYRLIQQLQIPSYAVGSRGAVGSSLVAYLLGVTEIDPIAFHLSPYFFFSYQGNRIPDIDMNLRPSDRKLFWEKYAQLPGVSMAIPCGTFGTYTEKDVKQEIEAIAQRILERKIKRTMLNRAKILTTLQDTIAYRGIHPGGIMIIPEDVSVFDNLPLFNAGDYREPLMTTGFDYYMLDQLFVKADFLAHDSLELIARLAEKTGVCPTEISLEDPEIMEMFQATDAEAPECKGLPEFTTDYAMDVLRVAKPTSFDDLVKILGLMHGTSTWLDNAEIYLREGVCDLREILASREDVFDRLQEAGFDDETAYEIAEQVRKGMVSRGRSKKWEEWKPMIREKKIPERFIISCETIEYLFPRAHAAGYMLMTWRLAWYKKHYPEIYFATQLTDEEG